LFLTGRLLSVMIRIDAASKQEVVVAETSVELDKTVGEKKYLRLSEVQETNVYFRRNKKE
jgi:hypothetical protein